MRAGDTAMPRGARLDAPGTLHHLMVRGIERKRIVMDDKDRKDLMDRMGDLAAETNTAIYAWALLNNMRTSCCGEVLVVSRPICGAF
jgi:hypothetical protein